MPWKWPGEHSVHADEPRPTENLPACTDKSHQDQHGAATEPGAATRTGQAEQTSDLRKAETYPSAQRVHTVARTPPWNVPRGHTWHWLQAGQTDTKSNQNEAETEPRIDKPGARASPRCGC